MKKIGVLNKDLSEVIASMGHYHRLVVCDAGFPIPPNVRRIDISLVPGMPSVIDVLRAVIQELCIESIVIAEETSQFSPDMYEEFQQLFIGIPQKLVPHDQFKQYSQTAIACVRSGECTPYSNIILVAGVTY